MNSCQQIRNMWDARPLPRYACARLHQQADCAEVAHIIPVSVPKPAIPNSRGAGTKNKFSRKVWFLFSQAPPDKTNLRSGEPPPVAPASVPKQVLPYTQPQRTCNSPNISYYKELVSSQGAPARYMGGSFVFWSVQFQAEQAFNF